MRRQKQINLPSLPQNWSSLTLSQFHTIEKIRGKFVSKDAYLTHCFLALTGLKPLRYAERWRAVIASIPLVGRFVAETGRKMADFTYFRSETDNNIIFSGIPRFTQYYRFKGLKNALFGYRFPMEDQELLYFQQKLKFLTENKIVRLNTNPVFQKRIGFKTYKSYYAKLADMAWLEYNQCSMFIERYIRTKETEFLDKFLAAFYKVGNPRKVHGKFTELEIHLILLFWNSCQQYFKASFPHLYKNSTGNISKDYMKEESEITVFLAKEAYMRPEDVREMRAYDALQYLETNAVLQEEKERQLNNIKLRR